MIDDLPEGWRTKLLGEVTKLVKDKVEPATVPDAHYIGLEHVEAHTMRLLGSGRGSDVKSAKTRFRAGDVLYGKLRPYLNKVTRPPFDGISSTDFLVFTESDDLDAGYLSQFLNQLSVANYAHHLSAGVELPRVDWKSLSTLPVSFPSSKDAQRAVVAEIEQARTLAGSANSHLAQARRVMERFRQAVFAAACSGRLTADWRESNPQPPVEPGPPLSAHAIKNVSGASNTSELADVPDSWTWWTVEAITSDVIDYRGRTPPHVAKGPIPHVRTTQIRNGRIDWNTDRFITQETYDKYMTRGMPQRDDVLFTMEAPMGEVAVIDRDEPFSIAQRILLLRPAQGVDGRFLALALQSHPVRRATELRATGSGVLGIAYKRLRSVEIPRPPLAEQLAIIERTERLITLADALTSRIDAASKRVDRSSQAVLAKAFRGELLELEVELLAL